MNKYIGYGILAIVLVCIGYYFFSIEGALGGLLAGLGVGAKSSAKERAAYLEGRESAIEEDIADIQKEREELEKKGVKTLTPEQEKDYWKDQ